jgi:hypothetical protein
VEQAAGKEERAVASWAACGRRKGEWAGGKRLAREGREEQAGLGWELGLLSYFLPFFFSNQLKSI